MSIGSLFSVILFTKAALAWTGDGESLPFVGKKKPSNVYPPISNNHFVGGTQFPYAIRKLTTAATKTTSTTTATTKTTTYFSGPGPGKVSTFGESRIVGGSYAYAGQFAYSVRKHHEYGQTNIFTYRPHFKNLAYSDTGIYVAPLW